jgi:C4-dicarboxylate-specific signal transduction histidine kinase
LNSLFEEISKIYTKLCTEKNIKLSIKVPTQMASIWANKMDIEEVLINLIKNAIEALDENQNPAKTLNVWCEKKSKLYLLNVSDNGPGIPDLYSELIFRPFWTTKGVLKNIQSTAPAQNASNNAKNQQGSGLGLYLSRMRCLEQGGKLILKKKKLGAHFVIEIPAYS